MGSLTNFPSLLAEFKGKRRGIGKGMGETGME